MENKKIKIAVVIRGFHSGGIEKVFESYYSHMDLSPYEIHIITNMKNMPEKQAIFEKMGCIIHPLSRMRGHKFSYKNIVEYRDLMRKEKFDVVHNNVPDNLFPLYFAKKNGVPLRILHAHNLYTEDFASKNQIVAALFKTGFAINTANATKLIGVSQLAADSAFAKRSGEAVILKNAIELEKFRFKPEIRRTLRAKLGVGNQDVLFGHVGRYENDQKNQEFVLNLFKIVSQNHANCKLVMIGEGKRRGEFMEMAQSLGVADRVIFTGVVANVNEYLSAMDLYLFPSRKEGLGIAGVEAQASGVKCIFSDKIPAEAVVTDNVTVHTIKGEGALAEWAADIDKQFASVCSRSPEDRWAAVKQLQNAGFDIDTQVKLLDQLYHGKL